MPEMDDLEYLEAIREDYPNLPFILFTGKGSEAVASDATISNVVVFSVKNQSGKSGCN